MKNYIYFEVGTCAILYGNRYLVSTRKLLVSNVYYSSKKASTLTAIPELMWAMKIVGESRLCYPEILSSLYKNDAEVTRLYFKKKSK